MKPVGDVYFAPRMDVKYCNQSVCLSVFLYICVSGHLQEGAYSNMQVWPLMHLEL